MSETVPLCMNCGLPQTKNAHAMAGKPSHLNIVGAQWGCLPCAEIRANGRGELFYRIKRLLVERIRSKTSITPETVLGFLEVWEEERLQARNRSTMESGAFFKSDEGQQP